MHLFKLHKLLNKIDYELTISDINNNKLKQHIFKFKKYINDNNLPIVYSIYFNENDINIKKLTNNISYLKFTLTEATLARNSQLKNNIINQTHGFIYSNFNKLYEQYIEYLDIYDFGDIQKIFNLDLLKYNYIMYYIIFIRYILNHPDKYTKNITFPPFEYNNKYLTTNLNQANLLYLFMDYIKRFYNVFYNKIILSYYNIENNYRIRFDFNNDIMATDIIKKLDYIEYEELKYLLECFN